MFARLKLLLPTQINNNKVEKIPGENISLANFHNHIFVVTFLNPSLHRYITEKTSNILQDCVKVIIHIHITETTSNIIQDCVKVRMIYLKFELNIT